MRYSQLIIGLMGTFISVTVPVVVGITKIKLITQLIGFVHTFPVEA